MKPSRAWFLVAAVVFIAIAVLITIARWNLFVAFALNWVGGIFVYGVVWRLVRRRRAEREIRTALEQAGYEIMQMKHRYWRTGLFSTWTTTSHNFVFRIVVSQSGGAQRIVWAKWGRYWFGHPDKLELRWERV
jgi:hypothetical protein